MKKDLSFLNQMKIAHRGWFDQKTIAENSKEAFQCAIHKNMAIELDIQLLKDDTLVVFHDDHLKRMTGYNKYLCDCTWTEIKNLHLLNTSCKIPTLEEVLDQVHGQVLLDIEIKTGNRYKKLIQKLIPLLDSYQGKFMIKSFDFRIIYQIKKLRPQYIRGLLVLLKQNEKMKQFFIQHFLLAFLKPDFLAYNKASIKKKSIQALRKKRKVLVWTLHEKEIKKYQDVADGYIMER